MDLTDRELLIENHAVLRTLCHDIANSLTIIMTAVSVSELARSEEELVHCLERIRSAADEQCYIINKVKSIRSLLSGTEPPRMQPLDLFDIVNRIVFELKPHANEKKVKIKSSVSEGVFKILCDPDLLYLVVLKPLVFNAIKYSPQGSEVTISAHHEKGAVCIDITDAGTGIPKKQQAFLFDLRSRNTTAGTAGEKGVGLGLPLAKLAMDRCGGSLAITSSAAVDGAATSGTTARVFVAAT